MKPKQDEEPVPNQARTIIAGARHALLTLPYDRVRGWVGLLDDGGEPVLLATVGSLPTRVAGNSPTARVDIPGPTGERLVLAGSLRVLPGPVTEIITRIRGVGCGVPRPGIPSPGYDNNLTDRTALTLAVAEVILCLPTTPDRGGHGRVRAGEKPQTRIDLAAYALAEPDLIAAYAPDLVSHLNTDHADQLRRLAEYATVADPAPPEEDTGPHNPMIATVVRSADAHELAGAQITHLDRFGMTMWRVGHHGAEEIRIPFRAPLREPQGLGEELRWMLGLVR